MNNILPGTVKLEPKFKPRTFLGYTDFKNKTQQILMTPNCTMEMGAWVIDPKECFSYYLLYLPPRPEVLEKLGKDIYDYSMNEFITATYSLIREYDKPAKSSKLNLDSFIIYCYYFGPLFWRDLDKSVPLIFFYRAFGNLGSFIRYRSLDNIHPVSKALALIIENKCQANAEIYIDLQDAELLTYIRNIPADSPHEQLRSLAKEAKEHFFHYPEIVPEICFIAHTSKATMHNLPDDLPVPSLKLRCTYADLDVLKHGNTLQKKRWYKQKVFENITTFIDFKPTSVVLENDKPIIQTVIEDPLTVFILKMVIDTENYNTCRYCGALTSGGKNYCNADHKEKYRRNTPKGKLDNLLRQWSSGNAKSKITYKEKDILARYGSILLDYGFSYETEILPRIQQGKKRLLSKRR